MSGASSVSYYRNPAMSYRIYGRTSPLIIFSIYGLHFLRTSLVGSIFLSMTYSINIRPYNDPISKLQKNYWGCCRALGSWCFHRRYYSHLELRSRLAPRRQFSEQGCRDAETCSNDAQYSVFGDRGINGMWFIAFSRILTHTLDVLRPVLTMIPRLSRRYNSKKSNIPKPLTKTLICWKMLHSRCI